MKLNVVKDASGKVVATFEPAAGNGPSVTPVLPEGHKTEILEVADDYVKNLKEIYAGKVIA